jgi:hypothetical protein
MPPPMRTTSGFALSGTAAGEGVTTLSLLRPGGARGALS